jgi:hypothetical protein
MLLYVLEDVIDRKSRFQRYATRVLLSHAKFDFVATSYMNSNQVLTMASYGFQRPIPSISRERSPVAVLTDRHSIDIGERDIRVDDYINDKLQTPSDFANLDSLIASVETQRIQLQDQVGISF